MRARGLILSLLLPGAYGSPKDGFFAKMSSLLAYQPTTRSPIDNVVNEAISQTSFSDNANVAAAGTVGNTVANSALGNQVASSMASALAGSGFSGYTSTASQVYTVTSDLNACSKSVSGSDAAIQAAYDTVLASTSSSSTVQTASAFKTALSYVSSDTGTQNTLYQLLVIWLDEQANQANPLTDNQEAAYATITPQCNKAFQEMSNAVSDAKTAVNFMYSNASAVCHNYASKETAGLVNFTLCTSETNYFSEGQWLTNVTGIFTNYGDNICNITFWINNLENAVSKSPSWLPRTSVAYPYGIPHGVGFGLAAITPLDVTSSTDLPAIDILNNFALCPAVPTTKTGIPSTTGKGTPTKPGKTSKDDDMYNTVANSDRNCFLTESCANLVAPFERNQCEALRQVFLSSCHVCPASVVTSAQQECLKTCSAKYCMPKSTVKTTSAAATSNKVSVTLLALAIIGLLAQWA